MSGVKMEQMIRIDVHHEHNSTLEPLKTVFNSVNDLFSNKTDFTTTTESLAENASRNNDTAEVVKNLYHTDALTIQEEVIIGAAVTVVVLAIVAIVLRAILPLIKKSKKMSEPVKNENLYDEKIIDNSLSDVSYTSIMPSDSDQSNSSSHCDQSHSSSQLDWSDSSSNQTKSTYYSSDVTKHSDIWKATSFGNLRGSTLSLPVSLPSHGFELSRPCSVELLNASLMTVLAQKSMQLRENHYGKRCHDDEISRDVTGSLSSIKTSQTVLSPEDLVPICEKQYNNVFRINSETTKF